MHAGDAIREARRRAGLTQAELASRAGTTQSAVARVERGRTSPTLDYLTRLLEACGFELEYQLVPLEEHDWTLVQGNRQLDASARVEKLLAAIRFAAAARASREASVAG